MDVGAFAGMGMAAISASMPSMGAAAPMVVGSVIGLASLDGVGQMPAGWADGKSVSYTHLDVYKRQGWALC